MSDIIVNSENFKRFSKRLQKAMTEAQLKVNLSQTQQFLSKAFGCTNVHELEQQFAKNSQPAKTLVETKAGDEGTPEWYERTYGVKAFGPHEFKRPDTNFLSHASLLKPFILEDVELVNNLIYAVAHILNYWQSSGFLSDIVDIGDVPLETLEKSLSIRKLLDFELNIGELNLKLPITRYLDDIGRDCSNNYTYLETHDGHLNHIKKAIHSLGNSEFGKSFANENKEYAEVDAFCLELMDMICSNKISPVLKCYQIDSKIVIQFKSLENKVETLSIELFDFIKQNELKDLLVEKMGSFGSSLYILLFKHISQKRKNREDSNLFGYQLLKRNIPATSYGKVMDTPNTFIYKCELLSDDSEIVFKGRVLQKQYALANSYETLMCPLKSYNDGDKVYFAYGSTLYYNNKSSFSPDIVRGIFPKKGKQANLIEAMEVLKSDIEKEEFSMNENVVVGIYKELIGNDPQALLLSDEMWQFSESENKEQNKNCLLTKYRGQKYNATGIPVKTKITELYETLDERTKENLRKISKKP